MKKILGFNPKFWCGDRMNIIRLSSYTSPDLKLHLPRSQATTPHISSYTSPELKLHLPTSQATPTKNSSYTSPELKLHLPRSHREHIVVNLVFCCVAAGLINLLFAHLEIGRLISQKPLSIFRHHVTSSQRCPFKAHCTCLRNPFPYLLTNSLSNLLPDRLIN